MFLCPLCPVMIMMMMILIDVANECFVNLNCSIKWNRKIRDIFRSFITNLCPFLIFLSKQILIVQFWVTWTDSFLMRRSVKDKLIVLKQNLYKKKHGNYNHVELINLLSTRFEVKDKKKWRGKSFFLKRGKVNYSTIIGMSVGTGILNRYTVCQVCLIWFIFRTNIFLTLLLSPFLHFYHYLLAQLLSQAQKQIEWDDTFEHFLH